MRFQAHTLFLSLILAILSFEAEARLFDFGLGVRDRIMSRGVRRAERFQCARCRQAIRRCRRCGGFHHVQHVDQNLPNGNFGPGFNPSFPGQIDPNFLGAGFGSPFDQAGFVGAGANPAHTTDLTDFLRNLNGSGRREIGSTGPVNGGTRPVGNSGSRSGDINIPQGTERSELPRIGVGGNPSGGFSTVAYSTQPGVTPLPSCQFTLTAKKGDSCVFITAAHCLIESADLDDPHVQISRFHRDVVAPDKKQRKRISLFAPDLGRVEATAFLNPTYVQMHDIVGVRSMPNGGLSIQATHSTHDIALVKVEGSACRSLKIEPLPLMASCPVPRRGIASRWLRRMFPVLNLLENTNSNSTVTIDGGGIKQGDSGGAQVCLDARGRPIGITGVLSTSSNSSDRRGFSSEATYSTNDSIVWAERALEQLI